MELWVGSSGPADAPGFHDRVSTPRTGRKGRGSLPFTLSPSVCPQEEETGHISLKRFLLHRWPGTSPGPLGAQSMGHRQLRIRECFCRGHCSLTWRSGVKRAVKQGRMQRQRMLFQVEGQEATETCGREGVRREDVKGNLSGQRV